jgi:uncharacterized protein (TIGR00375 family)
MNILELSESAKVKGVNLLGTGDFTHPKHLADLKADLEDIDNGVYAKNGIYFILSTEVANVFTWENKVRKVHNIILAPSFEIVDQLNERLSKWGKLDYDGRPMFGKTCAELMDLCLSVSSDVAVIPAHAWTPWFGVFGSNSGFDRLEDCFQEHAKDIFAIETGMSSDPAMNWRLSALDKVALVSFSDAHSPYPWRLGREACVFEIDKPDYFEMIKAIRDKDKDKFLYTIETDPAYGKYHYDGHRACNIVLSPEEAKKYNNICPVCRRQLTIGVAHRVEDLADRPAGFVPEEAIPFKTLLSLSEITAGVFRTTPESKTVWREFNQAIKTFGNELSILLDLSEEQLKKELNGKVVDVIMKGREGKIKIKPGYDGVYGEPIFDEKGAGPSKMQKSLLDY